MKASFPPKRIGRRHRLAAVAQVRVATKWPAHKPFRGETTRQWSSMPCDTGVCTHLVGAREQGGTSSPSAFAILRLMTSSNFVACSIGRSAGLSPLRIRPVWTPAHPGDVLARPSKARDETELDGIIADEENDGNRRRRGLGRECRAVGVGNDHYDPAANQIGGERRQSIILALRPAVFDSQVPALDRAGLVQALAECSKPLRERPRRHPAEEPDHRQRRLLRSRRERPRHCRTPDERDEFPPFHSITSSARARSVGGTVRPSALAVLRLITSSYLVGACTGRSPGLVALHGDFDRLSLGSE